MLKSSPISDAEEWAIHGYEGFGSVKISEWHNLEELAVMAELFDRCDNPEFLQGVMDQQMLSPQDALLYIEENYAGEHESLEDWADQFLDETGQLESVPKNLRYYIDFEGYGRDAEMSGDIFTIETGYKQVHVFWNR
jgi:antirestriction protein